MNYRADIDGLRAIAVLMVVFYHAFPEFLNGGFIGVDIFFVISGYLISTLIFLSLNGNTYSFSDFYIRRIRRIFPSLFTVLLVSAVLGWFVLIPREYKQLGFHIFGGGSFTSNLILWNESGYFNSASDAKPLLHLWSLGIEEQFYIIWPFILWVLWRLNKTKNQNWRYFSWIIATLLILIISFTWSTLRIKTEPVEVFYSPLSRFWELLAGATLASFHLFAPPLKKAPINRNYFAWFGIFCLSLGLILINKSSSFPGFWALLPTIGTAALLNAGLQNSFNGAKQAWFNRTILSHPFLVYFGLISFSLYLWHWPILSFAYILNGHAIPTLPMRFGLLLMAIVLSQLHFVFIEKPFRFGFHLKIKFFVLIVLMLALSIFGYAVFYFDGFPTRMQKFMLINSQFDWDLTLNTNGPCRKQYPGDQYCNISDLKSPPTVALIGDSHANHFFPALQKYYGDKENVLNLGVGACAPALYIDRGTHPVNGNQDCYRRSKPMYDLVLNSPTIHTVIMAFHHAEYFREDVKFIDMKNEIRFQDNYKNYALAFNRTVKEFEKSGKNVILIYDFPDLLVEIKSCMKIRPYQQKIVDCSNAKNTFKLTDYEQYDDLIKYLISNTNITIFDTRPYLNNYPVSSSGLPTYRDITHLSLEGSLYLAKFFNF